MVRHAHSLGDTGFFEQRDDTVLHLLGLVRDHKAAFSGSWAPSPDRSLAQRPQQWQDRLLIPDLMT